MLLLLLKRRFYHLLSSSSSFSSSSSSTAAHKTTLIFSPSHHHLTTTLPRFSTAATQNPPPKPPFIIKYLIDSCGFSPDKAIEASRLLTHLKSPSKPDSVLRFLKQTGFTDAHIRKIISYRPTVLCAKVEKTLKPKIGALQEMGFSESEVIRLILANGDALRVCDLQPKITFCKTLFRSNEKLLEAIRKNRYLLSCSLGKRLKPNVSFLRKCGISDAQIGKMLLSTPRFVTSAPSTIKAVVTRAEEMGVSRCSGMFWQMLKSVYSISRTTFDTKVKFLKSLGWSEAEILSAVKKMPVLMNLSAKNICDTIEYLMKEVGYDLSYVAAHPVLLTFSLERRLVPRHCVLRSLKREELVKGGHSFLAAVNINEDKFIKSFILPYKEKIPGIHETYAAACSGRAPIRRKV